MPPRPLVVAIFAVWLFVAAVLVVRELLPRFRPLEPTLFAVELIDEAGQQIDNIGWTVSKNGTTCYVAASDWQYLPDDDTFRASCTLWRTDAEPAGRAGTWPPDFRDLRVEHEFRVGRDERVESYKTKASFALFDPGKAAPPAEGQAAAATPMVATVLEETRPLKWDQQELTCRIVDVRPEGAAEPVLTLWVREDEGAVYRQEVTLWGDAWLFVRRKIPFIAGNRRPNRQPDLLAPFRVEIEQTGGAGAASEATISFAPSERRDGAVAPPQTALKLPPFALSPLGGALHPLHPPRRLRDLRPGQRWPIPVLDPFVGAGLGSAFTRAFPAQPPIGPRP